MRAVRTKFEDDTSACVKSMKLSKLHFKVTKNVFFNRDARYGYAGDDVSIFFGGNFFLPKPINLYIVRTKI